MQDKEKDALVGFRGFTGNDYISAFFMKGKCMRKKEKFIEAFAHFGVTLNLDESVLNVLEEYICHLYGYRVCAAQGTQNFLQLH